MTDDMEIICAGVLHDIVEDTDEGIKMLWLADKLSNMRFLAASYGEMDDKLWDQLHRKDPNSHKWYYGTAKTRYKEYRRIDISQCTCIGKGAKAEVYRYDDELENMSVIRCI
mgnify:CR=1 FL=1